MKHKLNAKARKFSEGFLLVILKYLISGSFFKKMATLLDIVTVTLTDIRPVN